MRWLVLVALVWSLVVPLARAQQAPEQEYTLKLKQNTLGVIISTLQKAAKPYEDVLQELAPQIDAQQKAVQGPTEEKK